MVSEVKKIYHMRKDNRKMQVTETIRYVGVNDHQIDLFEGQYQVPNGMSYNSYVILDEKVAVMSSVFFYVVQCRICIIRN